MKHKDKVKLARKHRTQKELKDGVGIFQTRYWETRKKAIAYRVKNKIDKAKRRKNEKQKTDNSQAKGRT